MLCVWSRYLAILCMCDPGQLSCLSVSVSVDYSVVVPFADCEND